MQRFHLAQLNIARVLVSKDDPTMADFFAQIDEINAVADQAEGFVWRLQDDSGNATDIQAFDDDAWIVNMSVWESVEALYQYTYYSDHVEVFRRKSEWFSKVDEMTMVLWWVPAGHIPDVEEAKERLEYLNEHGVTPYAFTLQTTLHG